MPKFNNTPNLNSPELNPSEKGADINTAKELEGEFTPEKQIKRLEDEAEFRQQEITGLTESVEGTKIKLSEAREKLGLPPAEEDPPSVFSEKEQLEKLQAEREALEEQREELIRRQEKERFIREEKEKILQEKLNELFEEFKALNPRDFESVFKSGKTSEGRSVESRSMGSLDPEVAQSLAKAFKEGIKLLPVILEVIPELLKKFDEDLTREATELVEQKMEEEKKKMKEERRKEEKSEVSEGETPPSEIKPGLSPIEGGGAETPRA